MNETCNTSTVNQTTETSAANYGYIRPEVNIYETKDSYVLEAELPGVSKEGLDISVEASTLTLTGHRSANELKAESLYRESSRSDYRRAFELDPAIDTTKIVAKLDQGVLTLTLPKAEQVKPRKVTVNA